jgi:hypothetical protein
MSIKSFSVVRRGKRPGQPEPLKQSVWGGAAASQPWVLRQEVQPYLVERHAASAFLSSGRGLNVSLHQCLQEMEERVVARMTAEFSRLLEGQSIIGLAGQQAQVEASIQQAMPPLPALSSQNARAWQIEQNAKLRAQFIEQCELASSKQVADLLDSKAKNRAATASHLKDKGKIFSVRLHGQDYFPTFQFDLLARRCHPEMAQLIQILARDYDPGWQLALWFAGPNEWLEGQTPLALWVHDRAAVVQAAKAESAAFDA